MSTIIGKGLLGSTFSRIVGLSSGLVIYASGVSNSRCMEASEFEREAKQLNKILHEHRQAKSLLYFSTCSIYDPSAKETPYVLHKKKMEEHVLNHPNGYVLRLPQLVGSPAPSSTLVPHLISKIRQRQLIQVWANARRNLIDAEDVALIVRNLFAEEPPEERIINIANPDFISVIELIKIIEGILELQAKTVLIPKGSEYLIDASLSQVVAQRIGIGFGPSYLPKILRKYY